MQPRSLFPQTNRELRAVLPETFVLHVDTSLEGGPSGTSALVRGVTQWLDTHWRAAKVICVDFRGYPDDVNFTWEPVDHPPRPGPEGCVRVLRATCSCSPGKWGGAWQPVYGVPLGLPKWVAKVLPACGNLTALHLRRVELEELPALPLLKHLLLEDTMFYPVLVASLQGLASLETLHVTGHWYKEPPVWDVRACVGLRRIYMGHRLAVGLARAGQDLCVPPACAVAIEFSQRELWRPWLVRLGVRLVDLRLRCSARDLAAASRASFMHAPQLMQLRHVTLIVTRYLEEALCLCVAGVLGALPQSVESLHLDHPSLLSEQAVVVVPASLRALRVKAVCDRAPCSRGCICPPSRRAHDLTFGLHAGLERLCLVLWGVRAGLQCLDAGATAGLRALNVQARMVNMDAQLAAEVAQRGRVLERCDVLDSKWGLDLNVAVPPVQVVHIGQGPVHMEFRTMRGCVQHWACTCGTCAECLGPETVGGFVPAWPRDFGASKDQVYEFKWMAH